VRGGALVACAWLRAAGSVVLALPDGEWADVLGERTLSGPIPVAELCGEAGIALLERQ
jgi:hypothetical protein